MKNTIDMDTSLKMLSDVIARVTQISRDLAFAEHFDAANVTRELVPRDHGVYMWRTKKRGEVAYIGSAVGTDGLRKRIIRQHLQPGYTKSRFRIAIVDEGGGDPREGSVNFIRQKFTISWVSCPDDCKSVIHAAESILIAALHPRYNKR